MRHKYIFLFFLSWPILAIFFSFYFSLTAFLSPIIFFGIPSLFLSLLKPQFTKKAFFASLLIEPFMIIVDYIAQITHTWVWPMPQSLFEFKIFHYVSIESLVWGFLQTYLVIIFFQFFFDYATVNKVWNKRSENALLITISLCFIFAFFLFFLPNLLKIPFWYITFGIFLITPFVVLEKVNYPKMFSQIFKAGIYFFYLNFTYEITALRIGWWSFPSKEFIGYVSFFNVTFPFEEFFFWLILFGLAILSYYEYFFNNER